MALRCRPGDLAVVIEGSATGAWVHVIEPGPPHPNYGTPSWECVTLCACEVSLVDMARCQVIDIRQMPAGTHAIFTDTCLWPIRPPRPPEAAPAPNRELEMT